MSDNNARPVRVMHLVSSDGVTGAAQQALFMPMLTRMPKARVKMLVVSLAPNAVPGAVLRQNGVPVYDVALSKQRFSFSAFGQLLKTVQAFKPDIIQAWGHTAHVVSNWLRGRCEGDVKLVWSVPNTTPLGRKAGLIDQQKLKYAAKFSKHVDHIVYSSEAGASTHRRVGFPEEGHTVVPFGVDPTRFKPDMAARRKIREQLGLGPEAFVIGMMAPFQPEYDHPTLIKGVGELIKTNPNICLLLAGHGVQKGNGPLMALVGGGTLGTRTQLLGEWSDVAAFFNACDLACSSALTDNGRMSLVIAMLCGVPCVATGMGAQGEVIGQFGVAIEPGSPVAVIRGITRILQMPPEKRAYMAQGARKHALTNFVSIRSLQKYLQLYYDAVGRKLTAATSVPAPEIDAAIPAPKPEDMQTAPAKPKTNKSVDMYELRDPDSLESRDAPAQAATVKPGEGDVLQIFETTIAKQVTSSVSHMSERARGVAEEHEDLLAPELISSTPGTATAAAPGIALSIAETASPVLAASPNIVVSAAPKTESVEPALAPASVPAPKAESNFELAIEPKVEPKVEAKLQSKIEPTTELALADTTITVSMKISLDATGTLEIPPELIFTPAVSKPAAMSAPAVKVVADAIKPVVTAPLESVAVAAAVDAKTSSAIDSIAADSSTVPALAVDALLTQTELALTAGPEVESLQLDLLGDGPSPATLKAVAAS